MPAYRNNWWWVMACMQVVQEPWEYYSIQGARMPWAAQPTTNLAKPNLAFTTRMGQARRVWHFATVQRGSHCTWMACASGDCPFGLLCAARPSNGYVERRPHHASVPMKLRVTQAKARRSKWTRAAA